MSGLSVGSTIAGCRLEAVAGRGGMGVVYRATQLALDRPVAVKAMAPQLAEDAAYRERFQRESQLAASIDHPNVIPVYEAGEFDGTLYLIMRWVDGTDLRALVNESGGVEPARAVRLLGPVASALAAAHRRLLVHRDVKPANVLITRGDLGDEEHVYLTDFGIARRTDSHGSMTRTGVFVGTPDYTAPERIQGGKGTPASDIYAFGCMLYETVTGQIPFDRPTDVAKMFAHMNDPIPSARVLVPSVSPQLDAVIARAMAKDPAERFGSAGEVVTALGRVLDEATTGEDEFRERLDRAERPTDATPVRAAVDDRPLTVPTAEIESPRRLRRIVAGVVVAALATAGIVALATGGGGGPSKSPTTGTPTAPGSHPPLPAIVASPGLTVGGSGSIPLPGVVSAMSAATDGDLWVMLQDPRAVYRLPGGGFPEQVLGVNDVPTAIAAAPSGAWVGSASRLALLGTGAAPPPQSPLSSPPTVIAVDSQGSVWTLNEAGTVVARDVVGGQIATLTLSPRPLALAVGEGALWAVNGNALDRIAVRGLAVVRAYSNLTTPSFVALDSGVWTASRDGTVQRLNPRNGGALKQTVNLGVSLSGLSAAPGGKFVWALGADNGTVYGLAPAGTPVKVRFNGSAPVAIAAVPAGVWVATADRKVTEITVR